MAVVIITLLEMVSAQNIKVLALMVLQNVFDKIKRNKKCLFSLKFTVYRLSFEGHRFIHPAPLNRTKK